MGRTGGKFGIRWKSEYSKMPANETLRIRKVSESALGIIEIHI
ncbi:hypothetical protein GCM10025794_33270 [Massilia kyonggiensis]